MKLAILSAALMIVLGAGELHAQDFWWGPYCGNAFDPPEPRDDSDKVPDAIREAALGLVQYLKEQARTTRDFFDPTLGLPIDPDRLLPFLERGGVVFTDVNDSGTAKRISRSEIARLVKLRDDKIYRRFIHLGYASSASTYVRWKVVGGGYEFRIGAYYVLSFRSRNGTAAVYKVASLMPGRE